MSSNKTQKNKESSLEKGRRRARNWAKNMFPEGRKIRDEEGNVIETIPWSPRIDSLGRPNMSDVLSKGVTKKKAKKFGTNFSKAVVIPTSAYTNNRLGETVFMNSDLFKEIYKFIVPGVRYTKLPKNSKGGKTRKTKKTRKTMKIRFFITPIKL